MNDFNFLPFQLTYILDVSYWQILKWVEEKKLKINGSDRVFTIPFSSLIDFLKGHTDYIKQLYSTSTVPFYNGWRT